MSVEYVHAPNIYLYTSPTKSQRFLILTVVIHTLLSFTVMRLNELLLLPIVTIFMVYSTTLGGVPVLILSAHISLPKYAHIGEVISTFLWIL